MREREGRASSPRLLVAAIRLCAILVCVTSCRKVIPIPTTAIFLADPLLFRLSSSPQRSFRQLYREEREPLAPVNAGSPKPLLGRAGSAFTPVQSSNVQPDSESTDKEPPSAETSRRRISRVVVEHQDSFETFYDLNAALPGGGASEEFFDFDNDTFWSGSITWY